MLAETIRAGRKAKNLTQTEAADLVGVSRETFAKWELGYQKPRPRYQPKLQALFGVAEPTTLAGVRSRVGLTQMDVGVSVDVCTSTVSRFEQGDYTPEDWGRWADAYQVSVDELRQLWRSHRCP